MRLPLLLSLLAALPLWSAEPVVATPWDVRKEAQELLEDLGSKRAETGPLFERAQALIAEHGNSLVACKDGSAPIATVVLGRLTELGLDEAFYEAFEGVAARKLALVPSSGGQKELLEIARGYPGTTASYSAWRRLADSAWDAGRLGEFVDYSRRGGDERAKDGRAKRLDAALAMMSGGELPDLPGSLDGLSEVWRFDVEERHAPAPRVLRQDAPTLVAQTLALSRANGESTAASDGVRFFVFDQLVGRMQGQMHVLGNRALTPRQCRPAVLADGFAAVGILNEQQVVVLALDRLGERRWQALSPHSGPQPPTVIGVSAPVAMDDLVVYAMTQLEEDNADLRVQAINARTGKLAWDALVARVPGARRAMYAGEASPPPLICVHEGSLLVVSNCGVLARVSADGEVRRVWNYPSTTDEVNPNMLGLAKSSRQGAIASDGRTAVATPADNAGLTLIIGESSKDPETYRGDGAGGDVLDVAGGVALFAAKTITCLDLEKRKPRWSHSLKGKLTDVQACIGDKRALVSGNENLLLLDLATGNIIAQRPFEPRCGLTVADQLLVFGGSNFIAAYGGSASTLDRLTAAATENPQDYRPRVRLAALLQARGDTDLSFARYLEALECGAPPEYAEKAARIVRERLDLAVGDAKTFPQALAKLQALGHFDPALAGEAEYWRARQAESSGDRAAAIAGYQAVLRLPGRPVLVRDRLEVHLHALARGGISRLDKAAPGLDGRIQERIALPAASSPWSSPSHRARTTVVAHGLAFGYSDGFLVATRLADGGEAWWRKPVRPLLGVQWDQQNRESGIHITVMPGTSAEAAGLHSGDILVEFNGKEIRVFKDLVDQVIGLAARGPYTATVVRDGDRLSLTGVIGGEMVEPVAANERTVLVWPTLPNGVIPEGMWLVALDIETGAELFTRRAIPATNRESESPRPILGGDDTIVLVDAQDLVAIAAHASGDLPAGRELWRLPGQAEALARARVLGAGMLWLSDPIHGHGDLLELGTGAVIARIPVDGESTPVIDGFDCFTRQGDLTISCWDIGSGRLRWRSTQAVSSVLGARGDSLFVITEENQFAVLDRLSGKLRRSFGSWTGVAPLGIVGDRLYLSARGKDRGNAPDGYGELIAAVSLTTSTTLWEQSLPPRAETQEFIPTERGLCVVLHDGDATWALCLGLDGAVSRVVPLAADHRAFPLADGLLDAGPEGLRVLSAVPPAAPPALATVAIPDGADLAALATAALPGLHWQACGKSSYAIGRTQESLIVFAKTDGELAVRFGDAGQPIDASGQVLMFGPAGADGIAVHLVPGAGGWRLAKQASVTSGADKVLVARLDPPLGRTAGLPLVVRGDAGPDSDCPPAPWWLSSVWHPLAPIIIDDGKTKKAAGPRK